MIVHAFYKVSVFRILRMLIVPCNIENCLTLATAHKKMHLCHCLHILNEFDSNKYFVLHKRLRTAQQHVVLFRILLMSLLRHISSQNITFSWYF